MLQQMYEQQILIYAMLAFMGIGLLAKTLLGCAYLQLIKAAKEMGVSENRLMKQIRLRFDTSYKIKMSVHNVDSFVDKYVYTYRYCGLPLFTLENIGGQMVVINLLIALFGGIAAYYSDCGQDVILSTLTVGACTTVLLIGYDFLWNLSGKQKLLHIHMKDYLENNLKSKLENESFYPEEMEEYRKEYFEREEKPSNETKGREQRKVSLEKQKEDERIIEEILKEYLV